MKKQVLSILVTGGMAFGLAGAVEATPIVTAEIDQFSGYTEQVTGNINNNTFTWSLTNSGSQDLMFEQALGNSVFDNSSNLFSSSNFSPSTTNTDSLGYIFTDSQNSGTFEIIFDNAVTNLSFHFYNLDRLQWDFSQTTTDLSLLSGNNQISVQDGIVRDMYPLTYSGQNSADGSVLLNGTFTTISGVFSHNPGSNSNNDSGAIQISFDVAQQAAPVPEPATMLLFGTGLAGLVGMSRRKKKK